MNILEKILQKNRHMFGPVLPSNLQHGKAYIFDLSLNSPDFAGIDFSNIHALMKQSQNLLNQQQAVIGIGRYAENREIYLTKDHFQNVDKTFRSVHLGIDLSVPAGTPISAPFAAKIHSIDNHCAAGDYGPTVILQHEIDNLTFYTLFGHLSEDSLQNKKMQQELRQGEIFAWVGNEKINGGWPPHLHFQIIDTLKPNEKEFIGVVDLQRLEEYLVRCPDPNLILNIDALSFNA